MSDFLNNSPQSLLQVLNKAVLLFVTDEEGAVLEANEKIRSLLGVDSQALLGSKIQGFLANPFVPQPFEKKEMRFLSRSGFEFWLELSLLPFTENTRPRYLWAGFDISERKATEQYLAESQLFSKALTQSAPVGLFVANPLGGCTYVNDCWSKQSDMTGAKAKKSGWQTILHPEDKKTVADAWEALVREQTPFLNKQYRYVRKDGQEVWIQSSAVTLYDTEQKIAGYLRIEQDVTERLRNEKIIQDQQVKIAANAKLSSLGEMAAGIAHEVNTPLAVIQLKADQLLDLFETEDMTPEFFKEAVETISSTSQRIGKIITGLRRFSRDGHRDTPATVDLRSVAEETFSLCRERFRNNGVPLELLIHPEPTTRVEAECRSTEISQVLLNLLNNAFDAIQSLSEKWVRVEISDFGDEVELSVSDSGAGIPQDLRDKIMQPFFTTKEIGKGTGLGLSISSGMIAGHGGKLFVDELSRNTRIVVRLPKKAKPQAA